MSFVWKYGVAVAAMLASTSLAFPLQVNPIPNDFVVTVNNTINATTLHNPSKPVAQNAPPSPLPLTFANNFGDGQINAYLTGTDGDGAAFFLQSNGQPYYPSNPAAGIPPTTITADIAIPLNGQGQSVTVNLPNYVSSGRIYFSVGTMSFAVNNGDQGPVIVAPSFTNPTDPNADVNYGFVEFTWSETAGIYSNLSYVDFVGLVIAQILSTANSGTCKVEGLPANAVETICSGLSAQSAKDGQAWDQSCQKDSSGNDIRVLAPLHLIEIDSSALNGYYDPYIDKVWEYYTNNELEITAGDIGNFTGKVDSSGQLTFNEGGSYSKPVLADILGCNSGPFANPAGLPAANQAIVPRLCAAFVRSTLLLTNGNVQPDGITDPSQYYPTDGTPTDHYARLVHDAETDGKGYAFAYDDVHPDNAEDVSGLCNAPDPTGITFTVGGSS